MNISKSKNNFKSIIIKNAFNQLLFGFVQGAKSTLMPISTEEAITMFLRIYSLSPNDYSIELAKETVERMEKEFNEVFKREKTNNTLFSAN